MLFVAMNMTSCDDGAFGGDYEVGGVELQEMCGTWVCTAVSCDPWYAVNFYKRKYELDPQAINEKLGDPYGKYNPDANGDGIVDDKDFETYEKAGLLEDEIGDKFEIVTSNSAANNLTEMVISDKLWNEVYKVNVDFTNKAFSVGQIVNEPYQTLAVTPATISKKYSNGAKPVILSGKILKNAAHAPVSQMVCDSIVYYVKYADDYGEDMYYRVSGYRKSGYTEDN